MIVGRWVVKWLIIGMISLKLIVDVDDTDFDDDDKVYTDVFTLIDEYGDEESLVEVEANKEPSL